MNELEDLLAEMGLTTFEAPLQNSDFCRASPGNLCKKPLAVAQGLKPH